MSGPAVTAGPATRSRAGRDASSRHHRAHAGLIPPRPRSSPAGAAGAGPGVASLQGVLPPAQPLHGNEGAGLAGVGRLGPAAAARLLRACCFPRGSPTGPEFIPGEQGPHVRCSRCQLTGERLAGNSSAPPSAAASWSLLVYLFIFWSSFLSLCVIYSPECRAL